MVLNKALLQATACVVQRQPSEQCIAQHAQQRTGHMRSEPGVAGCMQPWLSAQPSAHEGWYTPQHSSQHMHARLRPQRHRHPQTPRDAQTAWPPPATLRTKTSSTFTACTAGASSSSSSSCCHCRRAAMPPRPCPGAASVQPLEPPANLQQPSTCSPPANVCQKRARQQAHATRALSAQPPWQPPRLLQQKPHMVNASLCTFACTRTRGTTHRVTRAPSCVCSAAQQGPLRAVQQGALQASAPPKSACRPRPLKPSTQNSKQQAKSCTPLSTALACSPTRGAPRSAANSRHLGARQDAALPQKSDHQRKPRTTTYAHAHTASQPASPQSAGLVSRHGSVAFKTCLLLTSHSTCLLLASHSTPPLQRRTHQPGASEAPQTANSHHKQAHANTDHSPRRPRRSAHRPGGMQRPQLAPRCAITVHTLPTHGCRHAAQHSSGNRRARRPRAVTRASGG